MKKKLLMAVVVSMLAAMTFGGVASAHVHGVTPLLDNTKDNGAKSGGLGANGTPAEGGDEGDGPIEGLIPRDTGKAPLTGGDGGFGATNGHTP